MDVIKGALFGIAVGDALGVPVEFESRSFLQTNPVRSMIGFGTHEVPAGTWSDDSSLSFCLAEALLDGYDPKRIGNNFVRWFYENYWTATGKVFDVGITTRKAISRIDYGVDAVSAGGFEENENGNGSLMRILPLVFYVKSHSIDERYRLTNEVSSITHAHIRSVIGCFYFLEFARLILLGSDKYEAYNKLRQTIPAFLRRMEVAEDEIAIYNRLFNSEISGVPEEEIFSSGYVVHTLEASIWCLLTTENFTDAVLKAVNLGEDSDTTGAVTGGMAGILYGFEDIPEEWTSAIAKADNIHSLTSRFSIAVS